MNIWPGKPYPLGATLNGDGVNFALFAENAAAVELCLFDAPDAAEESERIHLPEVTAHVWHGYVPGLRPGQLYGYRVHGLFKPASGHRYNRNKLLIDPYARAITGCVNWEAPVFGYPVDAEDVPYEERDLQFDVRDDAYGMPKCVLIDPAFDWGDDRPLRIPWRNTIIYETHVKGMTVRHPEVEKRLRGTYAGLASPEVIAYLQKLGITAVELLPVHEFLDDKFLVERGLTNYWGYSSIGYFAPTARYSASGALGQQVNEFKAMVKTLHQAGIEVILDVVYNHTGEGNQFGPTFSFRGIDNTAYYRLVPDNPRCYVDFTGTGNSINVRHPQTLKLVMDSLRYWVEEMHVDGFRFDLAATLAREEHAVDRLSGFFDIVHQDPVISRVKLIAEPWDVGEGGYQVGNFPVLWTEWNGRYRDTVRRFWRGEATIIGELATRLAGSSDLYQNDGRRPTASINFITAHDGFTLNDLVSYDHKHNEANKEENRDGSNDGYSCNYGVEGPTDDPNVVELRERQKRNFLATLLLSQGVPMILGGDEMSRTQGGNNNAYCQDNEISWFNWDLDERQEQLLEFTRRLIAIRKEQPVLRRRKFFAGRRIHGSDVKDLTWFHPDGRR
ncbi:MAG: glycogen debranching protein GlgX [Dehalococcoidales bacterium]|nr:glycogen debranching protein GlgX [Dehalococcoidales bacterium]